MCNICFSLISSLKNDNSSEEETENKEEKVSQICFTVFLIQFEL